MSEQATRDVEAYARQSFERDTAEHEMTVLRDDELYRHLRFAKPGTYIYGYDLVTWPGYLAVVGDMGEYVFSRIEDMFKFFAGEGKAEGINPDYWGEKLRGPGTDKHLRYSEDAFKRRVMEWYNDQAEGMEPEAAAGLRQAVNESLLEAEHYDIHAAMTLVRDFEHDGYTVGDYWEWGESLKEYDHRFLWACWGIKRGIQRYYAHKELAT